MNLTNRIINGDKEAFDKVFQTYYGKLLSFVGAYINDVNDTEDIVQNSFVTLWEKRSEIKSDSHIAPLLFRIAKNTTLDFLRHRSVINKHSQGVRDEIVFINSQLNAIAMEEIDETRFKYNNIKSKVRVILMSLPIGDRKIFVLSRFNNLTNSEIAELLNLSPKTIEKRLSITLRIFKSHFKIFILFIN